MKDKTKESIKKLGKVIIEGGICMLLMSALYYTVVTGFDYYDLYIKKDAVVTLEGLGAFVKHALLAYIPSIMWGIMFKPDRAELKAIKQKGA